MLCKGGMHVKLHIGMFMIIEPMSIMLGSNSEALYFLSLSEKGVVDLHL